MEWRVLLEVLSRTLAAVVGGYAAAHAISILVVSLLALPAADAVITAGFIAFLVLVAAVCWAFAAGTALVAWLGLLAPTSVCGLLVWGVL